MTSISCGGSHCAVILSSGDLFTWGNGSHGALGLADKTSKYDPQRVRIKASPGIVEVSCGKNHTLAIGSKGEVFSCGDNRNG